MGLTSEEEIVSLLRKKDLAKYSDPSILKPLGQALWVLGVSKDETSIKKLTAKAISYILSELKEISLGEKAIINSFARAGNKIKGHKEGRKVYYEIMAAGRQFLEQDGFNSAEANMQFFSGTAAWSDPNKNFPRIINLLDDELLIVDPFYGNGTFHVLSLFGKTKKIRFLTCELGGDEQQNQAQFNINLIRFKKEFKNIEMRVYPNRYELHDRYIIAKNALVVIGHGIKDLANKESFVIFLPERIVQSILPELKKIFNKRWDLSTKI